MNNLTKAKSTLPESMRKDKQISVPRTFTSGSPMNPSSTRRWLIAVLAALGMLTATGAYAQTDTTAPTVTSVDYYADEAATIPISDVPTASPPLQSRLYIVIQFSENVLNVTGSSNQRPRILVENQRIRIGVPGTAFTNLTECNAKSASDTSEYICQLNAQFGLFSAGKLEVRLPAGETSDSDGNTLAVDYIDDGLTVVAMPAAPSVTSVSHYSDAGRTTTISDTVEGGAIYSVIQFAGWIIDTELADPPDTRPQIFYQISTATQVQFGGHATPGTPQNGTCALLEGGDGTVAANQSFWCRYNTRSNTNDSTYKIIVGTSTMDIIGQALAAEYTGDSVELDVTVGLATLSIANVSVNEGDGMATVSVTVNAAVPGGFRVDVMTTDGGSATAGEDYTTTTKELTFDGTTANETQTFTVPIIDDAIYDGGASGATETVTISLTNLQDAAETNVDISAVASISIIDNDYEVVLTMGDVSVLEGEGVVATVNVELNAAVPDTFSVEISTTDGSAIAGEDYTAATEELTFTDTTAGAIQTFNVTITNDDTKEFPETLTVSLSDLQVSLDTTTRVGILRPATATITIRDDDLGTNDSINLELILPITVNDKTYYWLDNNGNGTAEAGTGTGTGTTGTTDSITHNPLDDLLNGGNNTFETQPHPDGHDGRDDERSVIIGDTVLILPTVAEFRALRNNPLLANWPPSGTRYWTSSKSNLGHYDYAFGGDAELRDRVDADNFYSVIFQVLTVLKFEESITDQFYNVSRTVTVTLPEAIGGFSDLSYTLTGPIPDGLIFSSTEPSPSPVRRAPKPLPSPWPTRSPTGLWSPPR